MSIDFENKLVHGKYHCGVVLNTPSSRYRYLFFASVNVTKTDMATIQQNSAVGEEQNQQQSEFRNTTNSELEVEKRPLTFVQVIWLQIMGMGIFFSMFAAIAWIFLKRGWNTTQKWTLFWTESGYFRPTSRIALSHRLWKSCRRIPLLDGPEIDVGIKHRFIAHAYARRTPFLH